MDIVPNKNNLIMQIILILIIKSSTKTFIYQFNKFKYIISFMTNKQLKLVQFKI